MLKYVKKIYSMYIYLYVYIFKRVSAVGDSKISIKKKLNHCHKKTVDNIKCLQS